MRARYHQYQFPAGYFAGREQTKWGHRAEELLLTIPEIQTVARKNGTCRTG